MDKQHYVGMALNLGRDFLGFPSHMVHSILQLCTLCSAWAQEDSALPQRE